MTVRWGIAGPGSIARGFAEDLRLVDDAALTAVASRSQDRADAFAGDFGIAAAYGDYRALADDPDVDAVYVATVQSEHEANTRLFLEAGKHVLCEKPFALNAAEGRRMIEAAQEAGVFLMEAIWSRFLPSYVALGEVIADGRIGTPLQVDADFGFRTTFDPEHRHFARAVGGGGLLDLGIYPLQLCLLVLGRPERVAAVAHVGESGVDEQLAAVLHHSEGRLGIVKATLRVNLACTARISGTDGWIDLPAFMHCPEWIEVSVAGRTERIDASFEGNGLRFQVHEVHRCLAEGLTESPVMPHAETLALADLMDDIRAQVGVTFPADPT